MAKTYFEEKRLENLFLSARNWIITSMEKSRSLNAAYRLRKNLCAFGFQCWWEYISINSRYLARSQNRMGFNLFGGDSITRFKLRIFSLPCRKSVKWLRLPLQVSVRNARLPDAKTRAAHEAKNHRMFDSHHGRGGHFIFLISQKDHTKLFENLQGVVIVDEWHELGRKQNVGVQVQLGTRNIIQSILPQQCFGGGGLRRLLGNIEEKRAKNLLGETTYPYILFKSRNRKGESLTSFGFPEEIREISLAGHLESELLETFVTPDYEGLG